MPVSRRTRSKIRKLGLIEADNRDSWDLYIGAVDWIKAAVQNHEFRPASGQKPLRSFSAPGTAYNDPVIGKDPQIGDYRQFRSNTEVHAGSGIGTKAFYEAAQRVSAARAGEIWLAALPCLAKEKEINFKSLTACLLNNAGADRAKIEEALRVVGLGEPAS